MQHIQIKLLLVIGIVFLSVSGYGQMQQALRNGFVAATDSGIYHLQDGFSEWVKIYYRDKERLTTGTYYVPKVPTLCHNSKNLITIVLDTNEIVGNFQIINVFGLNMYDKTKLNGGSSYRSNDTYFISNKMKYNTGYVMSRRRNSSSFTGFTISNSATSGTHSSLSLPFIFTDLASDNDSIIVSCAKNNKLLKITINSELCDNNNCVDTVLISGIHSRSIDSHKICYNPNNDKFVIVSDSGIVYSYDKTSITTLDTISSINGGHLTGVYDLVYDDIFDRYYISFLDSDGFYDVQSFTIPINVINGNPNIISPSNPYSLSINSKGDILALSKNICYKINRDHGGAIEIKNIGEDIVVFDLDYINYLP